MASSGTSFGPRYIVAQIVGVAAAQQIIFLSIYKLAFLSTFSKSTGHKGSGLFPIDSWPCTGTTYFPLSGFLEK